MKKIVCLFFLLCGVGSVFGQQQPASDTLHPVVINDYKLATFSVGQTLNTLSDSVIVHHRPNLTALLEYTTPIYFKQNGLGMVSSPSFRGTTAQQTAVLWNGININSEFLGLTDFNTINTGSYNQITVRAGGGSVVYGTGAIGGTIHLNTDLNFKNEFSNRVYLGYGSFNTLDARYRLKASTDKTSVQVTVVRNSSDNDYKLHHREGRNKNGRFHNTGLNTAIGYRINHRNQINFYSEYYDASRHFSLIRPSENKTMYKNLNLRNLLAWKSRFGRFKSTLKGAFLSEEYKYFPNLKHPGHSYGKAETLIGKYDLRFKPVNSILIDAVWSHQHTNGFGTDIEHEVRNISSMGLLFKQQVSSKLRYQVGLRKEITHSYQSPLLYSAGLNYKITSFYTAKLSTSRNFRRPTFNDLYWRNTGDPHLKAEESYQVELGNSFHVNGLKLTLTGYFNDIDQMIHWLPIANGLSAPFNVDHVQTYGVEALAYYEKHFSEQRLRLTGSYAYTISKNTKTHKQLIYVPRHKATFSADYYWRRFSAGYQFRFVGSVYTRTDNDPQFNLSGYMLSNIRLSYALGKNNQYTLGAKVRNLFDKTYESVQNREMPGINFNFFLTLNF